MSNETVRTALTVARSAERFSYWHSRDWPDLAVQLLLAGADDADGRLDRAVRARARRPRARARRRTPRYPRQSAGPGPSPGTPPGTPAALEEVQLNSPDPADLNPRRYGSGEWRLPFAGLPFGVFRELSLPHLQVLDRDGLVAFLASMGWIADLPDTTRLPLLHQIRSLLPAAEYHRPWQARIHWARLEAGIGSQARGRS